MVMVMVEEGEAENRADRRWKAAAEETREYEVVGSGGRRACAAGGIPTPTQTEAGALGKAVCPHTAKHHPPRRFSGQLVAPISALDQTFSGAFQKPVRRDFRFWTPP